MFLAGCGLSGGIQLKNVDVSPNGAHVAVSYRCGSEPMRIGIIDISTQQIAAHIKGRRGMYADSPAYSNDGLKIAYTSGVPREFPNSIHVFDLRSKTSTEVLSSELPNGFPVFSPDDRRIAFVRAGRIRPKNAMFAVGDINVFEVSLASKKVKQVTFVGKYAISGLEYASDDKFVLSGPGAASGHEDAAIISIGSSDDVMAIELGRDVGSVNYIPPKKEFLFTAFAGHGHGNHNYEVFSLRNGVRRQITHRSSYIVSLAASADGRVIAYLSDQERDRKFELIIADLSDGSSITIEDSVFADCVS